MFIDPTAHWSLAYQTPKEFPRVVEPSEHIQGTTYAPGMLKHADLQPGDIIFTHAKASSTTHGAIVTGQKLQQRVIGLFGIRSEARAQAKSMDPTVTHVSIYTADRGLTTPLHTKPDFMRGPDDAGHQFETVQLLRPSIRQIALSDGAHTVYRAKNVQIGREMSSVATKWAGSGEKLKYNKQASWLSLFRSSHPGRKAAKEYEAVVNDGRTNRPDYLNKKGGFCSDLSVKVANAAHANVEGSAARPLVNLHGRNTSPMELEAYLRHSNHFENVGTFDHEAPTYRDLAALKKSKYHGTLVEQLKSLPQEDQERVLAEMKPKLRAKISQKLSSGA